MVCRIFNIDLGKRTQVLNVEYRDKKKDLIIPVLRKYQQPIKNILKKKASRFKFRN